MNQITNLLVLDPVQIQIKTPIQMNPRIQIIQTQIQAQIQIQIQI